MADNNSSVAMSIEDMAKEIHKACVTIAVPYGEMSDAQTEMQKKSKEVSNKRLDACTTVARLSQFYHWDESGLDAAVKLAAAMPFSNNAQTGKAIAVLCSQIKVCALPEIRGQFPVLKQAIADAWEAEQDAVKDAKDAKEDPPNTPLRKFVSRQYEMVLRACREIKEGKTGLSITCASDVVAWAIANDPDKDAERIAKRLKALATTLHEFYQEFPFAPINDAKQLIASVKAKDLLAVQAATQAAHETKLQAMPLAPVPPVVVARIMPTPQPEASPVGEASAPEPAPDGEVIQGAFDPTDLALNDAQNLLAA